jgi:ATP-dependent RNA helicase RhlB
MDFSELTVDPDLRKGLDDAGYVTCMPVQEMVFPHAFAGKDIYAQSQTGTGKTAAFLISIFQRMLTTPEQRARKVLVLAPTRELAVQIEGEAEKLGKYLSIKSGAFYGGVAYGPQVEMLRDNVQMIIGTPGRIIDLVQQGKMLLKDVGFLVIDEADRMFDMGFIDDIRKLLRYLPPAGQRQTFLFSATLGLRVKDLAWEYMVDPVEISIEPEHVTVDLVTQELYHVGSHEKMNLLLGLLAREKPESAIIFCNQKFMVEELARRLRVNGYDCEYIMGDLPQSKRLEIIEDLKADKLKFLVATDVAARGLDIEALDLVVNYDLPEEAESYVHRIGRTARAGKAGKAISLACEKFVYNLPAIERFLQTKIPVCPITDELLAEDKSAGMRFGTGRGPGRDYGHGYERGRSGGGRDGSGRRDYGRAGAGRSGGGRPEGRGDGRGAPRDRDYARSDDSRRRDREYSRDDREYSRDDREYSRDDRDGSRGRPQSERRPNEGQRQNRRPEAAGAESGASGGNPYGMSQDERMKRYREKYGEGQQGDGQNRPQGGKGPRPSGQNPDGKRPNGQGGQKPSGQRPEGQKAGGRGQKPEQRQGARPQNAKPQGQGKQGGRPQGSRPQAAKPQGKQPAAKKTGLIDRIKGLFRK